MNKVAVIIGNGKSREPIDLSLIKDNATIYGCNALYRTFPDYDHLIAIDDGMINELQTNNVPRTIIPPEDERHEHANYNPQRRRNNAGMVAMDYAIKQNHNILYLLGFDFILTDTTYSLSNVYNNTENYTKETRCDQNGNMNRIKYLEWYTNQNPMTTFVFVIPDDGRTHNIQSQNTLGLTVSKFIDKIT